MKKVSSIVVALSSLLLAGCDQLEFLPIAMSYTAKTLCSLRFVANQDVDRSLKKYIAPAVRPFDSMWVVELDEQNKQVHVGSELFAAEQRTAVYRDELGCTLLVNGSAEDLYSQAPVTSATVELDESVWPTGQGGLYDDTIDGVDYVGIEAALDEAFEENRFGVVKNTSAVLVVYDGKLIAERYSEGFNAQSVLQGYSMTKAVTAMLTGIYLTDNGMSVSDKVPLEAWQNTEKQDITFDNLLSMSSGLKFFESPGTVSEITVMTMLKGDHTAYAASRRLEREPGTKYNYSSGNSMVLSKVMQNAVGGSLMDAFDFYQGSLFHPVGIRSAVYEHDESGTFMGHAFLHMTPRDWARISLLYLQNGVWQGESVLPPNWVDYMSTSTGFDNGTGHFVWINQAYYDYPSLPADLVEIRGSRQQKMMLVPSRKLIVLRMGNTHGIASHDMVGVEELVADVLDSLP